MEARQLFRLYRYGKNRRFISLFNICLKFFNVPLKFFPQKLFWNKPSWICNQFVSDSNRIRTHNHLVSSYLYGAFNCMLLSSHVCVSEWKYTLYLSECQVILFSKYALSLSDSSGFRIYNYLVDYSLTNYEVVNSNLLLSLKLQISGRFWARSSLTFRQLKSLD